MISFSLLVYLPKYGGFPKMEDPKVAMSFNTKSWSSDLDNLFEVDCLLADLLSFIWLRLTLLQLT